MVVEEYKLMFFQIFKVSCTSFKQLFRRMEGYADWQDENECVPHNPHCNGLRYLTDYEPAQAEAFLLDDSWTKAVFFREPKQRFLSSYLDKSRDSTYLQMMCCSFATAKDNKTVYEDVLCNETNKPSNWRLSFPEFVESVAPNCHNNHWTTQRLWIPNAIVPYINFVGHMETLESDTRALLERIGSWHDYGRHGWPPHGQAMHVGESSVKHATNASGKLQRYFTPALEPLVDHYLAVDYESALLNYSRVMYH